MLWLRVPQCWKWLNSVQNQHCFLPLISGSKNRQEEDRESGACLSRFPQGLLSGTALLMYSLENLKNIQFRHNPCSGVTSLLGPKNS